MHDRNRKKHSYVFIKHTKKTLWSTWDTHTWNTVWHTIMCVMCLKFFLCNNVKFLFLIVVHVFSVGMAYRLILTDIRYLYSADIRYFISDILAQLISDLFSLPISDIYIGWMSTDTDIQYLKKIADNISVNLIYRYDMPSLIFSMS